MNFLIKLTPCSGNINPPAGQNTWFEVKICDSFIFAGILPEDGGKEGRNGGIYKSEWRQIEFVLQVIIKV